MMKNRLPVPSASGWTTASAAHDDAPGLGRTGEAPRGDQVHRGDRGEVDGLGPGGQPLGRQGAGIDVDSPPRVARASASDAAWTPVSSPTAESL